MFKTLFIMNISKIHHQMIAQHNSDVTIKKYLSSFGLYDGRHIDNYEEEYKRCFLMIYENNFGEKETMVFAYKHDDKSMYSKRNFKPDIIIGGSIYDSTPEQAIYKFCTKYGENMLDGQNIDDIVQNDSENILNYDFEKKKNKAMKIKKNIPR